MAQGGRIITMVRRFWGPAPPKKDLGASPLNSLNLNLFIPPASQLLLPSSSGIIVPIGRKHF
jgi:hypothetical protein